MTRSAIVEKAALVGYEAGYRGALSDLWRQVCDTCPDVVEPEVVRRLKRVIRQVEIVKQTTTHSRRHVL